MLLSAILNKDDVLFVYFIILDRRMRLREQYLSSYDENEHAIYRQCTTISAGMHSR